MWAKGIQGASESFGLSDHRNELPLTLSTWWSRKTLKFFWPSYFCLLENQLIPINLDLFKNTCTLGAQLSLIPKRRRFSPSINLKLASLFLISHPKLSLILGYLYSKYCFPSGKTLSISHALPHQPNTTALKCTVQQHYFPKQCHVRDLQISSLGWIVAKSLELLFTTSSVTEGMEHLLWLSSAISIPASTFLE